MPFIWVLGLPSHSIRTRARASNAREARWTFCEDANGKLVQVQRPTDKTAGLPGNFRAKLTFPVAQWYEDRLQACKPTGGADQSSECVRLYGMVQIAPGACLESSLDSLNDEIALQWAYMLWPADLYTGSITRRWACEHLIDVRFMRPSSARAQRRLGLDCAAYIKASPDLVSPVLPTLSSLRVHEVVHRGPLDCVTVDVLLRELSVAPQSVMGLLLPDGIARLVVCNRWQHLTFLARWGPSPFGTWPPEAWACERRCRHLKRSALWRPHEEEDLLRPCAFQHHAGTLPDLAATEAVSASSKAVLEDVVEWLDDCCDSMLSVQLDARHWQFDSDSLAGRVQYRSSALFAAFQASRNMSQRTRHAIESTMQNCVRATLPPAMQAAVCDAMHSSRFPGRETVRQAELTVDAALMYHERLFRKCHGATYMWWDSSPHGHDWLLSQVHRISKDDLKVARGAAVRLLQRREKPGNSDGAGDSKLLRSVLDQHMFAPVALGLRYSSLQHKICGFLHALSLESECMDDIVSFFDSIVSVTSDFGTEAGLAEFHCSDVSRLMPDWLAPDVIEPDGVGIPDDDSGGPRRDPPAAEWGHRWLCKFALTVPGLMHIVSNLLNEVHGKLSYWPKFHADLKTLEALLAYQPRRQRFIQHCVVGTPLESQTHALDRVFSHLYEKRWHHVLVFAKQVHSTIGIASWKRDVRGALIIIFKDTRKHRAAIFQTDRHHGKLWPIERQSFPRLFLARWTLVFWCNVQSALWTRISS